MKRAWIFLLALAVLLPPTASLAEDPVLTETDALKGAVLMEADSGARLWGMEADRAGSVSGLGKLPAILTLSQSVDDGSVSEDAVLRTSERAAGTPGPTAFLSAGEQISARELMKAAVMISAGDAILTLGEAAYGSESMFVENINVTMKQLGLSVAVTDALGTGLAISPGELALLGAAAANSPTFTKYCMLYMDGVTHEDGRETELVNANRLIKSYPGCRGLLTGSSPADGYCGVFAAARGGATLIAVVTGAENAARRTAAGTALLDYGFANFRFEKICGAGEPLIAAVPVRDGNVRTVDLVPREDVTVILKSKQGKLTERAVPPAYLTAPLYADVTVMEAAYLDESGAVLATVPLYPDRDVPAYGVKDILLRIMGLFVA